MTRLQVIRSYILAPVMAATLALGMHSLSLNAYASDPLGPADPANPGKPVKPGAKTAADFMGDNKAARNFVQMLFSWEIISLRSKLEKAEESLRFFQGLREDIELDTMDTSRNKRRALSQNSKEIARLEGEISKLKARIQEKSRKPEKARKIVEVSEITSADSLQKIQEELRAAEANLKLASDYDDYVQSHPLDTGRMTRETRLQSKRHIAQLQAKITRLKALFQEKGGTLGIIGAAILASKILSHTNNALAAQDPQASPLLTSGALNEGKRRGSAETAPDSSAEASLKSSASSAR